MRKFSRNIIAQASCIKFSNTSDEKTQGVFEQLCKALLCMRIMWFLDGMIVSACTSQVNYVQAVIPHIRHLPNGDVPVGGKSNTQFCLAIAWVSVEPVQGEQAVPLAGCQHNLLICQVLCEHIDPFQVTKGFTHARFHIYRLMLTFLPPDCSHHRQIMPYERGDG